MNETVKISPPWVLYAKKIEALFAKDPDVSVVFDEASRAVKVYVDGNEKYTALDSLLQKEKNFGGVMVSVVVIPANMKETSPAELIQKAFHGNGAFRDCVEVETPVGRLLYAIFSATPVQFASDNIGSPWGLTTTNYESIAKEVLDSTAASYCTNKLAEDEGV